MMRSSLLLSTQFLGHAHPISDLNEVCVICALSLSCPAAHTVFLPLSVKVDVLVWVEF